MTIIAATVSDLVSLIKHNNSSLGSCYATIDPGNFFFLGTCPYMVFHNITSDQGSHSKTDCDSDLTIVESMNFTMFFTIMKQVTSQKDGATY